MSFDINQLNTLDYDTADALLPDYLDGVVQQFAASPEGKAYAQKYPEFGSWIATFTEMSYRHEALTLTQMTKGNVQTVMEHLLPRKITLMEPAEADDAIPELVAFWTFLKREYNLRHAGAILTYLASIEGKFTEWMFDPAKGGIAKSFIMGGMQAGFDMTTQEGLTAFQSVYNQRALSEPAPESFLQKLGNLFSSPGAPRQLLPSSAKSAQPRPKPTSKGFGGANKGKKTKPKKN